jgi:hypothetical protein
LGAVPDFGNEKHPVITAITIEPVEEEAEE